MKKSPLFIAALAGLSLFASCSKDDDKTPTPTNPTPTNPTTPTQQATPQPTLPSNINGALIAIRTAVTTEQMGYTFETNTDIATAFFWTGTTQPTTYVDAGTVSINGANLDDTMGNHIYMKTAIAAYNPAFDLDNMISWNVAGKNGVPAITQTLGSIPEYSTSLPATITKANGLTLTINSSSADSVIVMVASGSKTVMKTYGPRAGSVTLTASDLSSLPAAANSTAILEVVPYNINILTFGGKNYAFVREKAVVKNVTIN